MDCNTNKCKKWLFITLINIVAIFIVLIALTVYVDPFFHYHEPVEKISYRINNQIYQNPGILKFFSYNTILTGSSMIENMQVSWFEEEEGCSMVKVPYSGSFGRNWRVVMDYAFHHHSDIKKIILNFDLYALDSDPDKISAEPPEYLYDDKLLNDIEYLLNIDTISYVGYDLLDSILGYSGDTMESAYLWSDMDFGRDIALANYNRPVNKREEKVAFDNNIAVVQSNLEMNILPFIKNNPETEFVFMFPPYSVLAWNDFYMDNAVDRIFYEIQYVIEVLLQYDNVKVYNFQYMPEIIVDLDRYMDRYHYDPKVSYTIVKAMYTDEFLMTEENYQEAVAQMKSFVENYDFEGIWMEN